MKIKDIKHDHSLTDLLKVILFSILMLAPILAIGVKCAYVVINKNAKDSYYGETINQKQYINIDTFIQNKNYYFDSTLGNPTTQGASAYFAFDGIENIVSTTTINSDVNNGFIYWHSAQSTMYLAMRKDTNAYNYYPMTSIMEWDFINLTINVDQVNNFLPYLKNIQYNKNSYLDNVFYYAIDEVAQEPLFNWTQNTAIYTGVNAMCTGMEITSPIIPILITYWFLLTCIYVIIDILIKGFTMLTHMIGSKMG